MSRRTKNNYVEVALSLLQELGGGPVRIRALVAMAQEQGLIGTGTWTYHHFSRKLRASNLFDTSVRGEVSLLSNAPRMAPVTILPGPEEMLEAPEEVEVDFPEVSGGEFAAE